MLNNERAITFVAVVLASLLAEPAIANERVSTQPVRAADDQPIPSLGDVFGGAYLNLGVWRLIVRSDGSGSLTCGASPLYSVAFPSNTYDVGTVAAATLAAPVAHEASERRAAVRLSFRRGQGEVSFHVSDARNLEPLFEQLAEIINANPDVAAVWRANWPVLEARDPRPVPPAIPGGYAVVYGGPEDVLLGRPIDGPRLVEDVIGFTIARIGVSGDIIYGEHKAPDTGVRTGFIVDARRHEVTRDIPLKDFDAMLKNRGIAAPDLFDAERFQGRPYGGDGTWARKR